MNVVVIMAVPHEEFDILEGNTHVHGVYNSLELFYNECKERGRILSKHCEEEHYYDKNYYYVEKVFFVEGTVDGVQE